jgi:Domain of unknown function (DUF4282)
LGNRQALRFTNPHLNGGIRRVCRDWLVSRGRGVGCDQPRSRLRAFREDGLDRGIECLQIRVITGVRTGSDLGIEPGPTDIRRTQPERSKVPLNVAPETAANAGFLNLEPVTPIGNEPGGRPGSTSSAQRSVSELGPTRRPVRIGTTLSDRVNQFPLRGTGHSCGDKEQPMSDTAQGPGWWQAVDHKWYPPEMHPGYRAQSPAVPPSSYQPPQGSGDDDPLEAMGFIRSLYDFSFSSFVTLRVIRVLYVLITILYSLAAVIVFIGVLVQHKPADIVAAIILVPIGYLIYLTFARIAMEILMVLFNIGKDVRSIRERGERTH